MNRIYPLAIAAFVFVVSPTARALVPNRALTQYLHRIWQTPQGLPQGTIRAIRQTSDGYLWLGASRGLVRFDGVRFTTVGDGGPLRQAEIRQLSADAANNLWIATNGAGLLRYRDGVVARFSTQQGLPSDNVHCVISALNGDIWACTGAGLARISGGNVTAYGPAQGLAAPGIEAAAAAKDGSIWAGGEGADLSVWNGGRFSRYRLQSIPQYAVVQAMLCARDGSVWVGTTDGLVRIKDGRERRWTKSDGLATNSVFSLAESQDGSIWIGTSEGFSRLRNGEEIESFGTRDGLSQSTVYALFEDREGTLWAGTKRGLNQFLDRRTIPFTTSEGLPSNETGPVLQDSGGTVWVGTMGSGLARLEGHKSTVLTTAQGLASNSVNALAEGAGGKLWVGTEAGLDLLANGRVERVFTKAQGLPGKAVRAVYRDREGTVWIGGAAATAVLRNGRLTRLPGAAAARLPAVAFAEDRFGRVLAATETGIAVYTERTLREIPEARLPVRNADALYLDNDGLLWIGTVGNGLYLFENGKLTHFTVGDGLFDDEIYGIAADARGQLWMACSKGIFSLKRSELRGFASGAIRSVASTPYSPMDGLQTVECRSGVQPAAWRMRDGLLSFSTIRGLLVVDPAHLDMKFSAPPVVIESVNIDGRTTTPADVDNIGPGSKNVEFVYTGLSFYVPSHVTFRYILEGFDRRWTDAGTRRQAFYTNLPHGSYRFRVTACNVDGTCNTTGSSVAFTVPAEFYQRPWFIALSIAALALLARLGYRVRIQGLRQQFDAILGERSRIARELHDTLIQGFSGVTMQMQALAARLAPESRGTLDDIIHDAAHCLTETRRSVADLRRQQPTGSGLAAAIEHAARQTAGGDGPQLKLSLDPVPAGLPEFIEHNLLKIAQEAVANSVKHSGAHTIKINLRYKPNLLRLSVQDNGSGLARGREGDTRAGHYGLIGMRERAHEIGASFDIGSEPGAGTNVTVALPIRRAMRQTAASEG